MHQPKRSHQRKTHLIKKDFQINLIIRFCLILLGGVVFSTAVLYFFSQGTLTSSFQNSRLIIQKTGSAILPAVLYTNLITLGLISAVTVFVTLFISHKIAGPIYRFEKEMKNIALGNLNNKISLRKNDQIREIAESLNQMAGSLHEKVVEISNEVDQLQTSAIHQKAPKIVLDEIERLKQKIRTNFKL